MADIGSTLREARMRSRIDISEVEAATKIRAKYLRALENEEWDLLPGPTYIRSFLRTYGNYLGLDSRMLADEFRQRYEGPTEQDLRPRTPMSRERDRAPRRRVPSWITILAVIVVIVGVLYLVGSSTNNGPAVPAGHARANGNAARHHRHHHRAILPLRRPGRASLVTLSLVPTGTVYVCLVNGAGQKLIDAQDYSVGQTVPVEKGRKLLLTLGNNSVQMKVDRRTMSLPASANAIRLLVTSSAVRHIPLSQAPTCP
jgi:cytoskeleton protein RodZ